jgi:tRNA nucleotidyltransferase (CCA-adding enzyme)
MQIQIPERVRAVMATLTSAGGAPLLVGGFVRDRVMQQTGHAAHVSKDVDLEVRLPLFELAEVLRTVGRTDIVGIAFGVLKLTFPDGEQFDVSVPRRESKAGAGHRGFIPVVDPLLSIPEAAARRDFTMNSLAADADGTVLDPFDGITDIRRGVLRATSERFADDPLRVLRGMQFAARFGLHMDNDTADMGRTLLTEFGTLSAERICEEWLKWARAPHPVAGLHVLVQTGWLQAFPVLAALVGVEQEPAWHPEGDVWTHTGQTTDMAATIARREQLSTADTEILVLAALLHDVGKPDTTVLSDGVVISHGHAELGATLAEQFLTGMRIVPADTVEAVSALVGDHMTHTGTTPSIRTLRRMALRLGWHTSIRMLALLAEADASGRFPAPPASPMAEWVRLAEVAGVANDQPAPIILGRHLIALGQKPGPAFGPILRAAFEAQLDGTFSDVAEGLEWLAEYSTDWARRLPD